MTTKITFNIECDTLADAELIAARLGGVPQRHDAVQVPLELCDDEYLAQVQAERAAEEVRADAVRAIGHAVAEVKIDKEAVDAVTAHIAEELGASATPSPEEAFGDPSSSPEQSGDVALASDGKTLIPYDERIHTSGANRVTKEGKWARRRNLQDSFFHEVEAELMGTAPTLTEEQRTDAPTHEDLSALIAKAFQPGAKKVDILEIFQNNGVANILEVGKGDVELIAKIYADLQQAMSVDDDAA